MRILQVITELTPAGAERVVCELSKGLVAKGHDVTVVSLKSLPENKAVIDELRNSRIDVVSLNLSKSTPWKIFGLSGIIKDVKPDILHSHLIHPNLLARFSRLTLLSLSPAGSSSPKFKLINTVHIAERRPGKWWHFSLDRFTYPLCDCQTAVSKAVRDFHSKKIAQSADDMPVIYNGVRAPKQLIGDKIRALRMEWEMEDCDKIIGSVGRLDWQKGYDIFFSHLSAISAIIPKGEVWGIVILGEGVERGRLERIVDSMRLNNIKVSMPGFRKDAADCISAFDLFVMPSRYEGFGLTLVEAMEHGIPILASEADSLPELMVYYINGICIDFNNREIVLLKISELIDNKRIKPVNTFSVDQMLNEYVGLYKKL